MTTPWLDDACALVDAYRRGEVTPTEAVEASLAAIEASTLNSFSHVAAEQALEAAADADVSLPFGGVPIGVKELDKLEGWPDTEASLVFKDRIASYTSTFVARLLAAGAIPVGLCTASEFGGLNVSVTKLNGITYNPWGDERSAGGSSGGSAAAVAGGLVPIATGGDGGGSIRIPAGFTGLVGLKATYGRIPRSPRAGVYPLTPVAGCMARSVRDTARWFDVCNGFDPRDPYSLPRVEGWEAGLGHQPVRGLRVAIVPDLGAAVVRPEVARAVTDAAEALVAELGWTVVDVDIHPPGLGLEWAMSNIAADLMKELGELWPDCKGDLTDQLAFGVEMAIEHYDATMATRVELGRTEANEHMADVFEQTDLVICASNPDVAYPARVQINTRVGDVKVGPENNGALTIPANITGQPAISIPAGHVDDLPVGMQVIGRHHAEQLLLDVALAAERLFHWPLVAPLAPR